MQTILLLIHTEADGSLAKSAFESLQAAQSLALGLGGAPLSVGLVGERVQDAANQIAGGASKFYAVEGADFAQPRYASDAAAAEAIAKAAQAAFPRRSRPTPGWEQ